MTPSVAHNPLRVQLPSAFAGAAAVLNVTAVGGQRAGFVTVYRCGDPVPGTSNVNFPASGIVPNLVARPTDATGGVCVFANQPTHLIVDLFGGLATTAVSLHAPVRAVDTRNDGGRPGAQSVITASTGEPPGTTGVVLNVTTTQPENTGFLTAFPCDASMPPRRTSTSCPADRRQLRHRPPRRGGTVCVFTQSSAHVIVDVTGTIGPAFTGLAVPSRAFDSRSA